MINFLIILELPSINNDPVNRPATLSMDLSQVKSASRESDCVSSSVTSSTRKKSKETNSKKSGLIGTFQSLFKNNSNGANNSRKNSTTHADVKDSTNDQVNSKPSVELLTFNKRTSDVPFQAVQQIQQNLYEKQITSGPSSNVS